jgi:hypothetical protein
MIMEQEKEVIEVAHDRGDEVNTDVNVKEIEFSFNDYTVWVGIAGTGHYFQGVWITVDHKNRGEGFTIRTKAENGMLKLSLDHEGGKTETKSRSYNEWIKLEQLEAAVKIIGNLLK